MVGRVRRRAPCVTFSSTTREYVDAVFFSFSYFTSRVLVPSFLFLVRFCFWLLRRSLSLAVADLPQ